MKIAYIFSGIVLTAFSAMTASAQDEVGGILTCIEQNNRELSALRSRIEADKYGYKAEKALEDPEFFRISTLLTLHVICGAICAIGNNDKVGRASASYIVDGVVRLSIAGSEAVGVSAKNHILTPVHSDPAEFMSCMEFCDLALAHDLFDGKVNVVVCVDQGKVRISGMISQVDNVNRILDRVALYLA